MGAMRPTETASAMTFAMPGYERANVYSRQVQMNESYWRLAYMQQVYEREQQAAAREAEEARQQKITLRKERRAAEQAKREAAKSKREALRATQTKIAGKE
jgi:protein subunit release factor B